MKRNPLVLAAAWTVIFAALTACPSAQPGQDPVLVNAQRAYTNTRDTLDLLFNLEMSNKALIETKLPGTHHVVDGIKTQAKVALPELLKAIDTYATSRDKANLEKWQAVANQLFESAKVIIANFGKQGIVASGPLLDRALELAGGVS